MADDADPSNSIPSQQASSSSPSPYDDGSFSSTSGRSNGSSSPSVKNYPTPENNQQDDDHVDADVAPADSTNPQPNPPAGEEPMADAAGVNVKKEGTEKEIGLLTELYNLHSKCGRYHVLAGSTKGEPDLYKFLIEEEKDYANKEEVDNKIEELHVRYLSFMKEDNPEAPTDPIDSDILRLSGWIWGNEIKSVQLEDQTEETDEYVNVVDVSDEDVNVVDNSDADADDDDSSKDERAKKKRKTEAAADDKKTVDADDVDKKSVDADDVDPKDVGAPIKKD